MPWISKLLAAAVVVAAGGEYAQAAEAWPAYDFDYNYILRFPRGGGSYLSLSKLLALWLMFLLWVRTIDWINVDGQQQKLPQRQLWNLGAVAGFYLGVVLAWIAPSFWWMSFPLLLIGWAAPLVLYVRRRNHGLHPSDQVFTPGHLRFKLSELLAPLGVKLAAEKAEKKKSAPVALASRAQDERLRNVHLLSAKQSGGLDAAMELLAEAFARRCRAIMLDYTAERVATRFQIDGVWHEGEARTRAVGDPLLVALKTLAGADPEERRARQQGALSVTDEVSHDKYVARLTTQGTKTGERALVQLDDGSAKKWRLADIGMTAAMQENLKSLLGAKKGIVLLSAPPGNGLSSLLTAATNAVDRYMRSVVALEELSNKELDVENVPVTTYNPAAGERPEQAMVGLARQYPDVYVVPDLANGQLVATLCEEVDEDRLIISAVPAKEAVEALKQVLSIDGVPAKKLAHVLLGVASGRLARKLCETCKQPYTPPAKLKEQLKQMGLAADPLEALYRPPPPPAEDAPKKKKDQPCADCQGLGYVGRVAFFELLTMDDTVRQALLKGASAEQLRAIARKSGATQSNLQEAGLALVVQGLTSLDELRRVLKD